LQVRILTAEVSSLIRQSGQQSLAALRRIAPGLLQRGEKVAVGVTNKPLNASRRRDCLLGVPLSPPAAK